MTLEAFSDKQLDSLFELLALGMYTDGHLADAEDKSIKWLANEAGLKDGYNLDQAMDRAISAARQVSHTPDGLRAAVQRIAGVIDETDIRQIAFEALAKVHRSDADDAESEGNFQQLVADVFGL